MEFSELLTVPGAALGAGLITQFGKILGLPGRWARQVSLVAGAAILLVATAIAGDPTAAEWFASAFAGGTAGLAAVAAYDAASEMRN